MKIKNVLLICVAFLGSGLLSNCSPTKIGGGGKKQPYDRNSGQYSSTIFFCDDYKIKYMILFLIIVSLFYGCAIYDKKVNEY